MIQIISVDHLWNIFGISWEISRIQHKKTCWLPVQPWTKFLAWWEEEEFLPYQGGSGFRLVPPPNCVVGLQHLNLEYKIINKETWDPFYPSRAQKQIWVILRAEKLLMQFTNSPKPCFLTNYLIACCGQFICAAPSRRQQCVLVTVAWAIIPLEWREAGWKRGGIDRYKSHRKEP